MMAQFGGEFTLETDTKNEFDDDEVYQWLKGNGMISLNTIYPRIKDEFGSEITLTDFKNIDDGDLDELCKKISLSLKQKMKLKSIIRESRRNANNNNTNNSNNSSNTIANNDIYSKYSKYNKYGKYSKYTQHNKYSKLHSGLTNSYGQDWIDQYNYKIGDAGRIGNEEAKLNKQCCRYNLSMILLGKSGVGKTSILTKFALNKFDENCASTKAHDKFETVVHTNNDEPVFLEVWDTVGQERYKSLTRQYFRGADCAIIVYDITNNDSFNCLEKDYISQVKEKCDQDDMCIMLVGNKNDLQSQRKISKDDGNNLANKHGCNFCEVSANSGSHIYPLFRACAQQSITMQSDIIAAINSPATVNLSRAHGSSHAPRSGCC